MSITVAIVDSNGMLKSRLSVSDPDAIALNTPAGCTAIETLPTSGQTKWDGTQWTVLPPTLADTQASKWNEISAARDIAMCANFTWSGSVFQADPDSQQRISDSALSAFVASVQSQSWTESWTLADNTQRVLSATDMVNVGQALRASVSAAFAHGVALRALIDAATSVDAVNAITWDTTTS